MSFPKIAFIIPCHNEEISISYVVNKAKELFPESEVIVCDNNSNDDTARLARRAGAHVVFEKQIGKGNAVRRLLRDIDADVFIMVDGDNTYDLSHLPNAVRKLIDTDLDLLTGDRMMKANQSNFRQGHDIGNKFFNYLFRFLFEIDTNDVFSGLRVFSRRLVKTFPIASSEFEIETELTIYASRMRLPIADFPTHVNLRVGSTSKLNTFKDGFKILYFSFRLLHREYPLKIYMPIACITFILGAIGMNSILVEFLNTGLVPRLPSLVFSLFLLIISILFTLSGFILKEISNIKYENRYLSYLSK